MAMELTGDVRAAILRVLEGFSSTEAGGDAAAHASEPLASRDGAMMRTSRSGVTNVTQDDHEGVTGRPNGHLSV